MHCHWQLLCLSVSFVSLFWKAAAELFAYVVVLVERFMIHAGLRCNWPEWEGLCPVPIVGRKSVDGLSACAEQGIFFWHRRYEGVSNGAVQNIDDIRDSGMR